MLAADVVGAIEDQMKAKGLQLVASNPDLVIKVYGSIDQETTVYTNDPLYAATGGVPPFDPSLCRPGADRNVRQHHRDHPQGRVGG